MLPLRTIRRHLLDFCYPGICAACEATCDGSAALCEACDAKMAQLEAVASCDRCARPLGQQGAPCPWCLGDGIYPYDHIIRLGTFSDPLKHLVHQMKYHRRWPLAEHLAGRLWTTKAQARELFNGADCAIAVPLHRWRQIERGYNQSEVIARRLCRHAKKKLIKPIVRLKATETQTHLHSRTKRIENLRDAFGLVNPRRVRGKRIIVIDDVMTTGATLQAVGRCLLDAQPASLSAIILAVADPKGKDFQSI